jgi:hypothetical protein
MRTEMARGEIDERTIGKALAIGLPLVTIVLGATASVLVGAPAGILVLAAGVLLGVVALLWGSLRVLSGDAPLSPELEALDHAAQGVDVLASRKKMLLRAIKDLENEHALGKLEKDDLDEIVSTYRTELKDVLKRIDATLIPHRTRAEELARAHLVKAGLAETGYRGDPPPSSEKASDKSRKDEPVAGTSDESKESVDDVTRVSCPKCEASNEADAKFCKECAAPLAAARDAETEEASDEA